MVNVKVGLGVAGSTALAGELLPGRSIPAGYPAISPTYASASMKTVYFVRHAKSSWSDYQLPDHDRPLAKRGKNDAPVMARRLLGLGVTPHGILTSTAKRAKQTAKAFRKVFQIDKARVITQKSLYHAEPFGIAEEIRCLPDDWTTVLVFGHNPGYTDLANELQHDRYIENVPTCGIIGARVDAERWEDFSLDRARRTIFMYPKQTDLAQ